METLVLAGNPNVGKSVLFQYFTGRYTEVSNFPGTTVDISRGKYKNYVVCDTPGIYGISSFSEEERIARNMILSADVIVNVIDVVHLGRDLFLTLQLLDMGKKMIVCLNMMDEAKKHGIQVNIRRMEELLGVPVVETAAAKGENLDLLAQRLSQAKRGKQTQKIGAMAEKFLPVCGNFAEAVLLLEDDDFMRLKYQCKPCGRRDESYLERRKRVECIVKEVITCIRKESFFAEKLSAILLHPVSGTLILTAVLAIVFLFLGVITAQYTVGFTEGVVMKQIVEPWLVSIVCRWCDPASVLGELLVGNYGLLTMVPTYLFGLILPLVVGFYFVLSVLEDSGYLPRIAVLLDKLLGKIGLNGRAVIPLILGFGCVTAATVSTRILETRRERIIATALLGLTIPCSAQLGILLGSVSRLGALYTMVYVVIIFGVFLGVGQFLNRRLSGESANLLIDLPEMRIPQLKNVLRKVFFKTGQFLSDAFPVFVLGALALTIFSVSGILNYFIRFLSPLVIYGLHLPEKATEAFIMGLLRRDFGAAQIYSLSLNAAQSLVAMVTLTLFVPCIASVMMIFKERSRGEAIMIWLAGFLLAFGIGSVLAATLCFLGVIK